MRTKTKQFNGSQTAPLFIGLIVMIIMMGFVPPVFAADEKLFIGGVSSDWSSGKASVSTDEGSTWTPIDPAGLGRVYAFVTDSSGDIYAAGSSGAISMYNGTWSAPVATGVPVVKALAIAPDGKIYAGGYDGTFPWHNSRVSVSADNGASWTPINPTTDMHDVNDFGIDSSGIVYAAGGNNGSNMGRVSKWNGSGWTDMPLVANQAVTNIVLDAIGTPIVQVDSGQGVKKWDGAIWQSLSSGDMGYGTDLIMDGESNLYVSGMVAPTMAGKLDKYITATSQWQPMTVPSGYWYSPVRLGLDPEGHLYFGGSSSNHMDGLLSEWNGSTWVPITLPAGFGAIYALSFSGGEAPPGPVPEPVTVLSFIAGIFMLGLRRVLKRR